MTPLFEVEHGGKTYAMTPKTLVDEMVYSSYRYNRLRSPSISPAAWATVFPEWVKHEQRFQSETRR